VPMPSYEEVTQRAGSLRAMTGLTQQEFAALLPPFEHAFLAYMEDHTIDGQPRTNRRYSTYDNTPLPTVADKLLFMLTYLKQNPIQEVQGQLFGMSQSNANKWIHLLHPVLNQALAQQELLPARTADELTTLLATTQTKEGPTSPLFGMMALSDRSTARKIPRSSKSITVARRSATPSKTCS
jgi:Helix-turn-helix of DDE superfamily endonuclease